VEVVSRGSDKWLFRQESRLYATGAAAIPAAPALATADPTRTVAPCCIRQQLVTLYAGIDKENEKWVKALTFELM
jgi:hypothetical protein